MDPRIKVRDLILVLVGVIGLLTKSWFRGAIGDLGHAYLGNVSASFAVYFLVSLAGASRLNRAAIAGIALATVAAFEMTNGFGVMTNVYDPWDYLADALGVALAYLADLASARAMHTASPGE